jgi:hypothetical protein
MISDSKIAIPSKAVRRESKLQRRRKLPVGTGGAVSDCIFVALNLPIASVLGSRDDV